MYLEPTLQLLEGDAVALLKAMEWIHELGMQSVTFVTNSQILCNVVGVGEDGMFEFRALVANIKHTLTFHCNIEIKFVMRQVNMVVSFLS